MCFGDLAGAFRERSGSYAGLQCAGDPRDYAEDAGLEAYAGQDEVPFIRDPEGVHT